MSDKPSGQDVLRERAFREAIANAVQAYMGEQMAMRDAATDQEQNWIAGHMATFAHKLLTQPSLAASALYGASSPSQPAGSFGYCAVCYHPLDRCSHCDGVSSPSGAWQPIETAPKDKRVLLFNPEEFGHWRVQSGTFCEDEYFVGWMYDGQSLAYGGAHRPTHWMPLPAPPLPSGDSK